mgnify:FL=1
MLAVLLGVLGSAAAQDKKPEVSFEDKLLATVPEGMELAPYSIEFSANGKAVAYSAKKGGKMFVVVGDKKGEEFDLILSPVFSADGKKVAYGARKGRELWWKVLDVAGK